MTAISFANALGVHEQALNLGVRRAEIIANNLANADTPGFKARDIDFRQVLAGASGSGLQMQTTHGRHLNQDFQASGLGGDLKYRTPDQVGIDGNTVDPQRESAEFAKNAMDFAASFRLLNGRFASLSKAIKGE